MEIQIFIGISLTPKLEQLYFLYPSNTLFIEEYRGQKYLGFFIPSNIISIDNLKKQKQRLLNYLENLFSKTSFSCSSLSFVIFPKSIIGTHKYIPKPG